MGLFQKSRERQTQRKLKNDKAPEVRDLNAICRQIRILNERLAVLELGMSTLRRNLNRVDRQVYREAERRPPEILPDAQPDRLGEYLKGRGL